MKLFHIITAPEKTEVVGGLVGDLMDGIATGIYNGFISIVSATCEFIFWAAQVGIIASIIIYIASKDSKAISNAVKLALIFIIASVVKSAL